MAIIEYNLFEPNIAAEIRTSAGESQNYFVKMVKSSMHAIIGRKPRSTFLQSFFYPILFLFNFEFFFVFLIPKKYIIYKTEHYYGHIWLWWHVMIVSAQNNRVTIAQNKLCSVLHTQRVKTFLDCAQLWCHILTHFGVLVLPGTVDISLFSNINYLGW